MKTYKQLQDKFTKDVEELQEKCQHDKSEWMPYMWAPGHLDGESKVCLICNKTLERRGNFASIAYTVTSTSLDGIGSITMSNE